MKESEKESSVFIKYLSQILYEKDAIKKVERLSVLACETLSAKSCILWIKERNTEPAYFLRIEKQGKRGLDLSEATSLIADAALNNKLIMTASPKRCAGYNAAVDGRAKAMIVLPVYQPDSEGEIIGVLQLCDKKNGTSFSNQDLKTALLFEQLAGSVVASILRDMESENNKRELVYALAESSERRQQKKSHHVRRVAESCALIAKKLELSPEDVDLLYQAAPLHDIGKMTIPDFVLLKPAKLTKDEFSLIKAHTLNGADILKQYDNRIMNAAAIIAGEHHEKYNGGGYPRGIAGEEINIFAQITALADVFDVLMLKSVYREPWPLEDALTLIRGESGRHFSPDVTEAFFAVLPEIIKMREMYPDNKEL